jgi:hypothetical protein
MNDLIPLPRRAWRPPLHGRLLLASAAAAVIALGSMAACDGDNMFSGPAPAFQTGPPAIVGVDVPQTVTEGSFVDIRVRAVAPAGLAQLTVRLRGAVTEDIVESFSPARTDTATVDVGRRIPAPSPDTILTVHVIATDALGRSTDIATRTVRVQRPPPPGPPQVISVTAPDAVVEGARVDLRIRAAAPAGLSGIEVRYRQAVNQEQTYAFTPVRFDTVTVDAFVQLPANAADSVLLVQVTARDQLGRVSEVATQTIRVIRAPSPTAPVLLSLEVPDSIAEGMRLDPVVRAHAPAGLSRVELRYRRALDLEQTYPVTPARTDTVTVFATVQLPDTVRDSLLVITAIATDQLGRHSEPVSRTVRVTSRTAPAVSATLLPTTVSAGDTARVHVRAQDYFGLTEIGFTVLTADGDTLPGMPVRVPAAGIERDSVFRFQVPAHLKPGTLRIVGFAVNSALLRGTSSPLALTVVDLLPPAVTILRPVGGDSHPLSDSLLVRVAVADSSGIAELRIKGLAIRGSPLTNTVVVNRYEEVVIPFPQPPQTRLPTDTVIARYLRPLPDTTSEIVYIIATARDGAGNVSADTVHILDGPRIEIIEPQPGLTLGIGQTLNVRVVATDRVAGLDRAVLRITGVRTDSIVMPNLAGRETIDTVLAVPTGQTAGALHLQAATWTRRNVAGLSQPVTVQVTTAPVADDTPPQVLRRIETPNRIELGDSIRIIVRATDGGGTGVSRMGAVVIARPDGGLQPRTFYRQSELFSPPLSGTPERTFFVTLGELYSELEGLYPRTFTLDVHAFAIDAAGNCGASVSEQFAALPCDTVFSGIVPFHTARNATPAQIQLTVTAGKSVRLPGGGRIADAVVDAARQRVYLSNIQNNRVEIFHLGADTFDITGGPTRRGLVGAAPWGLVISNDGDSLYVANSGGTNISVLPLLGQSYMVEDVPRRILTPNVILFDVASDLVEGFFRYTATTYDFSDRPQFIAQHARGTLFYSTVPTPAAADGTIRYVDTSAANPEVYLLHSNIFTPAEKVRALENVDSLTIVRADLNDDLIILYSRIPGTPTVVQSAPLLLSNAVDDIRSKGAVHVRMYTGGWHIPSLALRDTTFVAASTDRSTIAFGEGAAAPFGRVMLCCTFGEGTPPAIGISRNVAVRDLVNNAAERVFGVGLNADGSLGVARGAQAAYFFSRDLRLQGEFRSGVAGGSGGASLHPSHAAVLETGDHALAFVATGSRSIKIIDSAHFYERGEIHLRNNVSGPVRAVMPGPGDNVGVLPTEPNFIVVKLLAVTEGDHVVVVNVRRKDIQ